MITEVAAFLENALHEHNWQTNIVTTPEDEYLHLQHEYDPEQPTWLLRAYVRYHFNDSLGTGITETVISRLTADAQTFQAKPGIAFIAHAPRIPTLAFVTSLETLHEEANNAKLWATTRKQDNGYYIRYSRPARPNLLKDPRVAAFEFRGTFNHTPLA